MLNHLIMKQPYKIGTITYSRFKKWEIDNSSNITQVVNVWSYDENPVSLALGAFTLSLPPVVIISINCFCF